MRILIGKWIIVIKKDAHWYRAERKLEPLKPDPDSNCENAMNSYLDFRKRWNV